MGMVYTVSPSALFLRKSKKFSLLQQTKRFSFGDQIVKNLNLKKINFYSVLFRLNILKSLILDIFITCAIFSWGSVLCFIN